MSFFAKQEKKIFIFLIFISISGITFSFLKNNFNFFYNFLSLDSFNNSDNTIISQKDSARKVNKRKININTANYNELIEIPYIGGKTANKIIARRKTGKILNSKDLLEIPGIGPAKIIKIKKYISFDTMNK